MRYYLDGNNLAGVIFGNADSEGTREQLFILLQRKKLPKSTTIVFDGHPFKSAVENGPLRIVFSQKKKADEVILSQIKRGDILVTRDRELQSSARVRGAKIIEPSEFLSKIEPKKTGGEKPLYENNIDEWLKIFAEKNNEK
jgi:hypothetical protein